MVHTPWEGILSGVTAVTVMYNLFQLVPTNLLIFRSNGITGYPSDLFLALQARLVVPTEVIRMALRPGGKLSGVAPFSEWSTRFGDALELFLLRLTSAAGRRLYLALGATPFLECQFCVTEADYRIYAAAAMSYIYAIHLLVVALLTDPPRGYLARFSNWVFSGSPTGIKNSPPAIPMRSREQWRGAATVAVVLLWGADLFVVWAGDQLSLVGRLAHLNANAHLARHVLLAVIVAGTYLLARVTRPRLATAQIVHSINTSIAAVAYTRAQLKEKNSTQRAT